MLTIYDIEALRRMTIPPHYPRIAAQAATRIANSKAPHRTAILCSVEEIVAMGLVAASLLEPAFREPRGSK